MLISHHTQKGDRYGETLELEDFISMAVNIRSCIKRVENGAARLENKVNSMRSHLHCHEVANASGINGTVDQSKEN